MLVPSDRIAGLFSALESGTLIREPICVVIAHPDDEVLGMGGRLAALGRATLIQITDGSPRCAADRHRLGVPTREAYARARELEAGRALAALGFTAARRIRYGIPDQDAALKLAKLAKALEHDLVGFRFVFTHPYEGGHPDHDAAAFAVQNACDAMNRCGHSPPVRLEFASYHCRDNRLVTGQFWSDPACSEVAITLSGASCRRKRAALGRYTTQRDVIAWFDSSVERYRSAPRYDFTHAPPPGAALYDAFGWSMTSKSWRRLAETAMRRLGGSDETADGPQRRISLCANNSGLGRRC